MSADTSAVAAAALASLAALVGLVALLVLSRTIRGLRRTVDDLRRDVVPLVRDARLAADQAATELVRVGDVLGSAEAVSATVDSASRLAYRAFSNPVVKVLAFASGLSGALRRLLGRAPRPAIPRSGDMQAGEARAGHGRQAARRRRSRARRQVTPPVQRA